MSLRMRKFLYFKIMSLIFRSFAFLMLNVMGILNLFLALVLCLPTICLSYFIISPFMSLSSPSNSSNLLVRVREISVLASWLSELSLFGSFGSIAPSPVCQYIVTIHHCLAILFLLLPSERIVSLVLILPSNDSTSGTSPRSFRSSCRRSLWSGAIASLCSNTSCEKKTRFKDSNSNHSVYIYFINVKYTSQVL